MIIVSEWLKRLKYLVTDRKTHYDNHFPGNCGLIWNDGSISFDCIGMEKTVLNYPDIVYKTSPAGFYVQTGLVVPDGYGSIDLLNTGSGIGWHDFRGMVPGEHLYLEEQGHGGVYVGDLFGKDSGVNVIECTVCWGVEGVVASWIDLDTGARRDMRGGQQVYTWDAHSKLKFVDYSEEKKMSWIKAEGWKLKDADGKIMTGWQKVNGKWYSLNSYGMMRSGWFFDPAYGGWFLLNNPDKGEMLTGWQKVGAKWYYLQPSNDGKHVTGIMRTGWLNDKGKTYYLDPKDGYMYTGTHVINGKTYTFDSSGALIK